MDVKSIAVIGAGTMGRGIAYAAAFGGYKTVLEDISPRGLEQATSWRYTRGIRLKSTESRCKYQQT